VHADRAALPIRTFNYTSLTNYYEDDQFTANSSSITKCGPSWNTGNGSGCLLWSKSYATNSRFLSSASNGQGYFSSAMAINLVISELLMTAFVIPLAANQAIPILTILLWGAPLPILLPLLFFRHSRSLWMAMDHYLHPINVVSEQITEGDSWRGYR
jgi:hypothetical protein